MSENILPRKQNLSHDSAPLLDRPLSTLIRWDWETVAWIGLMVLAIVTRFYDLGTRAMSHDESLHALYSYYLYDAGNYDHNPMMHGPLLFHLNAVLYFLFGVSDVTARIAPTLAGIATVFMARLFRGYIGRVGALMAGLLITISPSLLFHSRYIRNDIYIALFTLIWIYGAFRYLDTRRFRYLLIMVVGMALGFVTKENHFIGGALIGSFFAGLAFWRALVVGKGWAWLRQSAAADLAIVMLTLVMPFVSPLPFYLLGIEQVNWQEPSNVATRTILLYGSVAVGLMVVSAGIAYYWFGMRSNSINDEEEIADAPLTFGGWATVSALFWIIEVLFFTTFLTNARNGLATGIVGSLGYWLTQQDVARGGQPLYYYPMLGALYEFLPIILSGVGMVVALYWIFRKLEWDPTPAADLPAEVLSGQALLDELSVTSTAAQSGDEDVDETAPEAAPSDAKDETRLVRAANLLRLNRIYFIVFCIVWVLGSWASYTAAGEKMPWLMTHMALPMCIFGGWYLARLFHRIDWQKARKTSAIWLIGATPALLLTLAVIVTSTPSFGREQEALGGTMRWALAMLVLAGLCYLIWRLGNAQGWRSALRLMSVGFVALLFLLTIRFSFMLTYINYDMATEYLVYAHAGPDVKLALEEIDRISERTVGGRNIEVAYDDDSSWPLSWYMRLYPNSRFYGANPTSDVMQAPVIIVGSKNYEKVHPYVARDYEKRVYRLVWWPDQGYFGLTWDRFWNGLTDPATLKRIAQVVFYRRYRDDEDPTQWRDLTQWPNRHEFEMYVRRDIAAEIWGVPLSEDPNNIKVQARNSEIDHQASVVFNGIYADLGLNTPRAVAVGPNGSIAIADSGNHRVVLLDQAGNELRTFGSFCNLSEGEAGGCVDPDGSGPLNLGDGQFNEPWGIAMGQDGSIFVSDTWNGRIQLFDADGNFVRAWGFFNTTNGELGDPNALFGPRGIALDGDGNLYVADTGNKRILHFTPTGELITQVGGGGVIGGRFEEPVGIAVDPNDGSVYVADAWNRRIQKLTGALEFVVEWPVAGWESQLIYDKPYVAVAPNGDVYASDPEFYRVFVYSSDGTLKASFGNFGAELNRFALPNGLAVDPTNGTLLVADADNNRVMVFPLLP